MGLKRPQTINTPYRVKSLAKRVLPRRFDRYYLSLSSLAWILQTDMLPSKQGVPVTRFAIMLQS